MRVYILLLALLISVSCRPKPESTTTDFAYNEVSSIEKQNVEKDGTTWTELTITQKVNPKSPSYIVGIAQNPKTRNLRWLLMSVEIKGESVITRMRVRHTNPSAEVELERADFQWSPFVKEFEPVKISTKPQDE